MKILIILLVCIVSANCKSRSSDSSAKKIETGPLPSSSGEDNTDIYAPETCEFLLIRTGKNEIADSIMVLNKSSLHIQGNEAKFKTLIYKDFSDAPTDCRLGIANDAYAPNNGMQMTIKGISATIPSDDAYLGVGGEYFTRRCKATGHGKDSYFLSKLEIFVTNKDGEGSIIELQPVSGGKKRECYAFALKQYFDFKPKVETK